eukprot:m.223023 g.223023  ORF g.223023 m.223023 type:complete len:520 (+) comp10863_c0_seq1:1754-3313(+)
MVAQEIVHYDPQTKRLEINQAGLEAILLNPEIKDLPVAVLCVAGIFRSGKSFLLNFFLSYLSQEENGAVPDDWIKQFPEGDTGFVWRSGHNRITTGIAVWSKPFIRNINGQKTAVLLMDTQGTFDNQSTMTENIRVFSLGALLGSLLINNVSQQISEDKLQQLELFVKFGQLIRERDQSLSALQATCFLVRDWQNTDSYEFGLTGGDQYIKTLLAQHGKSDELATLRASITRSFDRINGYLMPSPGDDFKESRDPNPNTKLLREKFVDSMKKFVTWAVNNLPVKQIASTPMTATQLCFFTVQCVEAFNQEGLPQVEGLFQSVARMNCLTVKLTALQHYLDAMKPLASGGYVTPQKLTEAHQTAVAAAMTHFSSTKKLGAAEYGEAFQTELTSEITERFKEIQDSNTAKRTANRTTGMLLLGVTLACNIVGYLLSFLGLSPLVGLLSTIMWVTSIALLVWTYCLVTGEFTEIRDHMDDVTAAVMPSIIGAVGPNVVSLATSLGSGKLGSGKIAADEKKKQ